MKFEKLKLLYVCHEFPYPPTTGGLVDMWNRIQALYDLGVSVDLIATPRIEPSKEDRKEVEKLVRRLFICKRRRGILGVFSVRPGFASIRNGLRRLPVNDRYDAVLMQTEFTSEILRNESIRHKLSIIRVDNDEYSFFMETAKSERSWLRKLYFLFEAVRIRFYTSRTLSRADMLWFVSHLEMERYIGGVDHEDRQRVAFVPTAVNLSLRDTLPLSGAQVLFVGSLWHPINREAVEWFVRNVHPTLNDMPGYKFVIAGSTLGQSVDWLKDVVAPFSNIEVHFDAEDLQPLYAASSVFVNPMQRGAGVKLKTIEAVLRGLPVVSTPTGAEGSGLIDAVHFKCVNSATEFSAAVKEFLSDPKMAREFAERSQKFIMDAYDQKKVLEELLKQISCRSQLVPER